jgi:hypothetical protein
MENRIPYELIGYGRPLAGPISPHAGDETMTHFVGRTLAGTLLGVTAMTMSAHSQTVVNPLENPAPAYERGGQTEQGTAKASAPPKQRADQSRGERDAPRSATRGSWTPQNVNQQTKNEGYPYPRDGNPISQSRASTSESGDQGDAKNQGYPYSQIGNPTSQPNAPAQPNGKNQGYPNPQLGSNDQGDHDRSSRDSRGREHMAMRTAEMHRPDIGLWFNRDGLVISDVSTRGRDQGNQPDGNHRNTNDRNNNNQQGSPNPPNSP